jgi:hypothetical protein
MMACNDELGITGSLEFVLGEGFCRADSVRRLMNGGREFILEAPKLHKAAIMAADFARPRALKARNRTEPGARGHSSSGRHHGSDTAMRVCLGGGPADFQMDSMPSALEKDEALLRQKRSLAKKEAKLFSARFITALADDGALTLGAAQKRLMSCQRNSGAFVCPQTRGLAPQRLWPNAAGRLLLRTVSLKLRAARK